MAHEPQLWPSRIIAAKATGAEAAVSAPTASAAEQASIEMPQVAPAGLTAPAHATHMSDSHATPTAAGAHAPPPATAAQDFDEHSAQIKLPSPVAARRQQELARKASADNHPSKPAITVKRVLLSGRLPTGCH